MKRMTSFIRDQRKVQRDTDQGLLVFSFGSESKRHIFNSGGFLFFLRVWGGEPGPAPARTPRAASLSTGLRRT